MVNKRPVLAALLYRPDFTFTPSLWGRPNDFYLPLRKHIKAISDCGSPSVFDHRAAVLAEARLVFVGILLLLPPQTEGSFEEEQLIDSVCKHPSAEGRQEAAWKTKHDGENQT